MDNITIVKGQADSVVGAQLNMMALEEVTHTLIGTTDPALIEQTMIQMWRHPHNRFSHSYVYEARLGEKTLGIVTCYPAAMLDKLSWPTLKALVQFRRWPLLSHTVQHLRTMWNLANLQEGREDEFHIGSLAALPESRGMGVGTKLMDQAEEAAREQSFRKTSLTVKQTNTSARRLYERLGYTVVDKINRKPFFLYRMAKLL
ncbi:GNAT family N-acetyltransferase [Paenibacillus sp. 1P07SE]|uniref:GNAT family N-acetyltransferase n=1 Tax=Paenibacillus sp. 1P07SE TaxID=3132209 RepID=UPI0039A43EA2